MCVKLKTPANFDSNNNFVSSETYTLPFSPFDSILFEIITSAPYTSYLTISVPNIPAMTLP